MNEPRPAPRTLTIQSKADATPEEIGEFYKSLRRAGCNARGTLILVHKGMRKKTTFTFKGWDWLETAEGGDMTAEHKTYGRHTFSL
jgi:hypothetical protein